MKIRSGFVSNSSSSSFIVNCEDFESVRDLAIQMIQIRDWENDEDDIRAINNLELDPDHPLSFSTCNYDTYIAKEGNYYLVTTCNNHPFDDVINGTYDKLMLYRYGEDLADIRKSFDFYRLYTAIIGRALSYNDNNRFYCCEPAWIVKRCGKTFYMCPECGKDKDESLKSYHEYKITEDRKKKLERII